MLAAAGDWPWMLGFFPLWIVMAGLWFSVMSLPKRMAGPRLRQVLDSAALSLSLCSATGILIGLNCGAFISLPFADEACHTAALHLNAWVNL